MFSCAFSKITECLLYITNIGFIIKSDSELSVFKKLEILIKNKNNINCIIIEFHDVDLQIKRITNNADVNLHYYYENAEDDKKNKDLFKEYDLRTKFAIIGDIIGAGNAQSQIDKLEEARRRLLRERDHQLDEFQRREEELLNAWNNFQSWKSETSKNLIKDLNSKFKENA